MESKLSRNAPCPCGSGKKYKKCCGQQKTVSITSIIEKEIMALQVQFVQYAIHEFSREIESEFEMRLCELQVDDEEEMEFYAFVHAVWFALFEYLDDEKTILEHFIEARVKLIQRPQMKEILQSWRNPRPIAGRMLNLTSEYITIRDTLTDEVIDIKLLEEVKATDHSFVFAFIVPFGQEWIFFTTLFDSKGEQDGKEEHFLLSEFSMSGYEDPVEFLTDEFLVLMSDLPIAMTEFSPDDFEWPSEGHKKVANIFEKEMKRMETPNTMIAAGLILWYKFCEYEPRLAKKSETYAAAIHYLNMTVNPLIDITKKEIAGIYHISPSTLGTAIADMEYVLQNELRKLRGLHIEQLVDALEAEGIGFEDNFYDEFEDSDDDDL